MTSPVSGAAEVGGVVALAAISEHALSVEEVLSAVGRDRAGAVALFVGQVRDHDLGREVVALGYSAHPSAVEVVGQIAARYAARPGVEAVALVHRVGDLVVGDLAIVAAVSCAHRAEAFAACAALVEEVKAELPIWKHQRFIDGSAEWVGIT